MSRSAPLPGRRRLREDGSRVPGGTDRIEYPTAIDVEEAVLGSALISSDVTDQLLATAGAEVFTIEYHRACFGAISELHGVGQPVTVLTVKDKLLQRGALVTPEDALRLHKIHEHAAAPAIASHYIGTLVDYAERRRLMQTLGDGLHRLSNGNPSENVRASVLAALEDASGGTQDSRLLPGGTFALDGLEPQAAVWGAGQEILWARGEPIMLTGAEGVGKSTIAQRITRALVGADRAQLLGLPVSSTQGRVLYVAADRPAQARRSMKRMTAEQERGLLDEQLLVHSGHPAFDPGEEPGRLASWARQLGADVVILDSLGALFTRLSEEEGGQRAARAFDELISLGMEVLAVHHNRKATAENRHANGSLDDTYGSRWVTRACGSVLAIMGRPSDPIVALKHVKSPSVPVGPLRLVLDHDGGRVDVEEGSDLVGLLRAAPNGLSVGEAARLVWETPDPDRAQKERVRRSLQHEVERARAYRREEPRRGGAIRGGDRYFATPIVGAQEPLA